MRGAGRDAGTTRDAGAARALTTLLLLLTKRPVVVLISSAQFLLIRELNWCSKDVP